MKKTFQMSIVFGLMGLISGLFISFNENGKDYSLFPIFSFTSSLIISFFIWKFFIIDRKSFSIGAGIFSGITIIILSHYFAWYFMSVYGYFCTNITGKCLQFIGEQSINPLEASFMVLPLTFYSLIIAWITLPLGAFLGAIVIKLQNNSKILEKN
ncbi:MAG: hypothetical protein IPL26_15105 [Leptospiraceae bacterium]|nr:hypothetical protein [Leptospiraceae bacterium]